MKQLQLLFIFLCFAFLAKAQTYPVTVVPTIKQPAPIYFSNYADPSVINGPLQVQIILNDLSISNREIRFKTYFEGNGISFQSNAIVNGASPLFLEGGIPLVLNASEIAPYYEFTNTTGISANVYGQPIPEGSYEFCYEVYDAISGNRISQKTCATTYIFQNEPPFLVYPQNRAGIQEQNPQNIVFQWTPRHINVSNVEYELTLVEIWDNNIDPQAAFLSSRPVFTTTTRNTTYIYGPTDPLLLSNKRYAWRVKAKALQGAEEVGVFKNNGDSEIFSFILSAPCKTPQNVTHEVKGMREANIYWDDFTTDISEFTVRYREKGEGNQWFSSRSTANWVTLWDLRPGTVYEYQVAKKCELVDSDYSTIKSFTTFIAEDESGLYNCGIPPAIDIATQEPLVELKKGDVFKAGDFPVKVQEVSGNNGRFTGKGYVTIPYLKSVKVAVEFTNVFVNTDSQLAEGMVITKYDPSMKNILDVDEAIKDVTDAGEAVGEMVEGDNDLDEIRVNFAIPEGEYQSIITKENGEIVVTNPVNGAKETSPLGDDKVIIDSEGNTYHVDAGGDISVGGKIDKGGAVTATNVEGVDNKGRLQSLTSKDVIVTFENQSSTYGFDEIPYSEKSNLNEEYITINDANGNDYVLTHKAVEKDKSDNIVARVKFNSENVNLKDLRFKTQQGELLKGDSIAPNLINISLKGYYTFENEIIYAVVQPKDATEKQQTAGAFQLWHLTDRTVNIKLVRVNNAEIPTGITSQINKIFKKGVASVNVEVMDFPTSIDPMEFGADGKIEIGDKPWLNSFNDEQKKLIRLFKSKDIVDNNTYYLFVFGNDIMPSRPIAGFMPLQRQFGFVFNTSAEEEGKAGNLGQVIAHEIGHGIFALQHPFTENGTSKGATDWLMDYGSGSTLNHMNWAQIHNPDLKFYVFQDEEEGEIANKVWFTPDWVPFKVEDTRIIISKVVDKTFNESVPVGAVPGFRVNETNYYATFDKGKFIGYFTEQNELGEITTYTSLDSDSDVYLFQYNGGCGFNRYFKTKYYHVNSIISKKGRFQFYNDTEIEYQGTIECRTDSDASKLTNALSLNICDYLPEHDKVDEYGVKEAIKKLNEAYKRRNAVTNKIAPRNKNDYYHLINISKSDFNGKAEILEDKLYLLKQKTGIDFYVVFQPVSVMMNEVASDAFAAKVLNGSDLLSSDNAVLITVPYAISSSVLTSIKCVQPGFAQSSNTLVTQKALSFKQDSKGNLFDYALGAFTNLKKPLFIKRVFLKADGTILSYALETEAEKGKRGAPYINRLEFYKSPRIDKIDMLTYVIGQTDPKNNEEYDIEQYRELRKKWINDLNALILSADVEESEALEKNDLNFWREEDIEVGKLREFYITDDKLTNYYVSTNSSGGYMESWKILFNKSKLESKHLYNFDEWKSVDQTLYNTLDVISLIPGADNATDIIGSVYAGIRGDITSQTIYVLGLSIPFVGSAYLKKAKSLDEFYAITAKKYNGKLDFKLKKVIDINDADIQVSPIITRDSRLAEKIRKGKVESFIDKNKVSKIFNNATKFDKKFNDALVALKQKYKNDPDFVKKLDEIASSPERKKKFLIGFVLAFSSELFADQILDYLGWKDQDLNYYKTFAGAVAAGTREAFESNSKIVNLLYDCLTGMDFDTILDLVYLDLSEDEANTMIIGLSIECIIPVAIGEAGSGIFKAIRNNTPFVKNGYLYFKNQMKLSDTNSSKLLRKLVGFDELFEGQGKKYKKAAAKLFDSENGREVLDIMLSANYSLQDLKRKNYERLLRITEKYQYDLDDLAKIFRKKTVNINAMIKHMDNMKYSPKKFNKIIDKVINDKKFQEVITINGKSKKILDYFSDDIGGLEYYLLDENNIRYYGILKDKEGVLLRIDNVLNVTLSISSNILKEYTKQEDLSGLFDKVNKIDEEK
ncbi:fibronectin type III domain-containing protein [Joostella atrarenae]|uniref:Fibronectin type III domain-containing protein n=1 Tax=Joostella atrarenae TaxID=679257 RepID=A0ABS9J6X0_9FLAO|nr:fibronectin type III domain-containing protein [Joostella atrarenae]MCF8716172.1 fibronectin type III domain-containing protein [Joostella atrarenae]